MATSVGNLKNGGSAYRNCCLPIHPAAANRTRPHPRLLAVRQIDRTERHRRIGERDRQHHAAPAHSASEPRRMQDAAIDRMRRDVVLTGQVEPPLGVKNDLLMDVAVGAADMDVRAGVVRNQHRILATPHPGEILRWLHPRRIARTEHRSRRRESQRCFGEHRVSLPIYPLQTSFGHMTTLRSLFFLACLGLTSAHAQQRPLEGFDAYVAKAVSDWRVPGLAIVVVKDDSVVFIKGYGVRELGKPDPVTVHTRFGNMSTTKAFTALLVAMLADSGRVAFDDPVQKYLPGLQFADPYVTRELTVRDLLTHRVGFADPDYLWGSSGWDLAAMIPRLKLVPATTSFRSRFQYNNVTYALAGDVAAHAAGTSWQSLLHSRILGPLGMTETLADASELRGISDVTAPHGIVRDTVRVLPAALDGIDDIAPAGAIFSTATDMAKWLRFVLDSGKVAGRRLVSAPNFAELFRPQQIVQRPFYPTARLTHPHFQAYGLGWILQDHRGVSIPIPPRRIEGRSAIVG